MTSTNTSTTMERIREDLLRRARLDRQIDVEQGNASHAMAEPSRSRVGIFSALPQLFTRGRDMSNSPNNRHAQEMEGPKSPDVRPRLPAFGRLQMPDLTRVFSRPSQDSQSHQMEDGQGSGPSGVQSPGAAHFDLPVPPEPVSHGTTSTSESSNRAFVGGESRSGTYPPSSNSEANRQEQDHRERRRHRSGRHQRRKEPPKRFLFCFPWIKSKQIRTQVLRCFVSGLFLVTLLSVYLGLSMTNRIKMGEFTIALVLIVLLATTLFCYGIVRLCMLVVRGDRARANRNRLGHGTESGGFAVPSQPIRVVLASDEEAVGTLSESSKVTPPAYGAWRESVRVDPNRLFWQRNDSATTTDTNELPGSGLGPRPPSYISDDGVSYVVDAVPRSTAPSSESGLPPHPSEVGRIYETSRREGW